jgi:cell division protein FtsI (penicillin-binding protein 3)
MRSAIGKSGLTLCALLLGAVSSLANDVSASKKPAIGSPDFLDRNGSPIVFSNSFRRDFIKAQAGSGGPVTLSISNELNAVVGEELAQGLKTYSAKAALAFVSNVNTGELIALSSQSVDESPEALNLNRVSQGIYEIGSIGRLVTLAMALDTNKVTLGSKVDATKPIKFQRHIISDVYSLNRELTVAEVFYYSSNVGVSRIVEGFPPIQQRSFFAKLGQLQPIEISYISSTEPIFPRTWERLNAYTISFGHGMAISPLHAGMSAGALLNGGRLVTPTLAKREKDEAELGSRQIISAQTSEYVRYLFRRNAEIGSAKAVDVPGFFVGGVSSTANKVVNGKYVDDKVQTSFISAFPMEKPEYLLLVLLDEPEGNEATKGFKTASWNAGMLSAKIIERAAPMIGVKKRPFPTTDPFPEATKSSGIRVGQSAENQLKN